MRWDQELNGHKVFIEEVISSTQGVVGLLAKCASCRAVLDGYSMADYSKYRLAMAAARQELANHVAVPFDEQDGVW